VKLFYRNYKKFELPKRELSAPACVISSFLFFGSTRVVTRSLSRSQYGTYSLGVSFLLFFFFRIFFLFEYCCYVSFFCPFFSFNFLSFFCFFLSFFCLFLSFFSFSDSELSSTFPNFSELFSMCIFSRDSVRYFSLY